MAKNRASSNSTSHGKTLQVLKTSLVQMAFQPVQTSSAKETTGAKSLLSKNLHTVLPPMKQHLKLTAHFSAHLRHADLAPYKEAVGQSSGCVGKALHIRSFIFRFCIFALAFFFDCLNNYFLDKESKVKLGDKKCLVNWKCGQFCTFFVLLTYQTSRYQKMIPMLIPYHSSKQLNNK